MIRDITAHHTDVAAHVSYDCTSVSVGNKENMRTQYTQHLSVNDYLHPYLIFSVRHVYISCLQFFLMLIFYICILYSFLFLALRYHTESCYTCRMTIKGVHFNDDVCKQICCGLNL